MKYVIYQESIDDYGKGRTVRFDQLEKAQAWWKEWFGDNVEVLPSYCVAHDGVSTAYISVEPQDAMSKREAVKLITGRDPFADWD